MKKKSNNVIPIYARGFFSMNNLGETSQLTVFYYYDKDMYYYSLDREERKEEIKRISKNMQYFLNKEKILINGERVKAKVRFYRLGFLSKNYPFIEFLITFKGSLKKGINVYEDIYEEEVTEYPYEALWILPGKIVEAEINGKIKVKENMLFLKVKRGIKVGGHEKIVFLI